MIDQSLTWIAISQIFGPTDEISSLVGYYKKRNAFLVYFICFGETVHHKWCLHKSVGQTENGLERGFC